MRPILSVATQPIKVTLLTFTATEKLAVERVVARPEFGPTPFTNLRELNDGVVAHFDVGASGNVAAAAYAARHVSPGEFHYLVTFGCAGAADPSLVCRCDEGVKKPGCMNPYLVNFARYAEIGRVEESTVTASLGSASVTRPVGPERVRLKKRAFESPTNRYRLALSDHVAGHFNRRPKTAFVSEKVIHAAPGPGSSEDYFSYANALANLAQASDLVIDMETAGVASGAPAFVDLTAVIRVVTDHGVDKNRDVGKTLQQNRLIAHSEDLFRILDYLTTIPNTPLYALLSWVILGAARHITRLERPVGRMDQIVDVMVQLALNLIDDYQPMSGFPGWSRGEMVRYLEESFAGQGYPTDGIGQQRSLENWGELVFACDAGFWDPFLDEASDDRSNAAWFRERLGHQTEAASLAAAFRERLIRRLRDRG